MAEIFETKRENFTISTNPSRLNLDAISDMLSRSYWANKRTREQMERALKHSVAFGLFDRDRQVGLARIVSDFSIFAYLCDVIIHEDYRGKGLGKWLLETVHNHPDLMNIRRWMLVTRDAHDYYRPFGWEILPEPEQWMSIFSG